MPAAVEALGTIHEKLTALYTRILDMASSGGACEHCGAINEKFAVINPAVLGHVNKFLSENDITALAVPGSAVAGLKKKVINLPSVEAYERLASGE